MNDYFSEQHICHICKQEKPCVSVLGMSASPDGSRPRLFPNMHKTGTTFGANENSYSAELYICEECAKEYGKDNKKVWNTWLICLAICVVALIISLITGPRGDGNPSLVFAIIPPVYTVFVVCSLIFVARWDAANPFLVLLAFTPLIAIPILMRRKRIDAQRQAKTALETYMPAAIREETKRKKEQKAGLARNPAPAKQAESKVSVGPAVTKSEPEDPGNTFYAFVVKGRGLGQETPGMQTELAKNLKSDCPDAAGMRLKIVEPGAWNGKVQTEDSGGVFMSSAGISDQIPGIRYYLKRAGVNEDAAEAGIEELQNRKIQRVNPAGGLFVFGVPVK